MWDGFTLALLICSRRNKLFKVFLLGSVIANVSEKQSHSWLAQLSVQITGNIMSLPSPIRPCFLI